MYNKLIELLKISGTCKIRLINFIFIISLQVVREYIDGLDLETLMKNPSLCPSLRSPEKKMAVSVGK